MFIIYDNLVLYVKSMSSPTSFYKYCVEVCVYKIQHEMSSNIRTTDKQEQEEQHVLSTCTLNFEA